MRQEKRVKKSLPDVLMSIQVGLFQHLVCSHGGMKCSIVAVLRY